MAWFGGTDTKRAMNTSPAKGTGYVVNPSDTANRLASKSETKTRSRMNDGNPGVNSFTAFEIDTLDAWDADLSDADLHTMTRLFDKMEIQRTANEVIRRHAESQRSAGSSTNQVPPTSTSTSTPAAASNSTVNKASTSSARSSESESNIARRPSESSFDGESSRQRANRFPGGAARAKTQNDSALLCESSVASCSSLTYAAACNSEKERARFEKFQAVLSGPEIDLDRLKSLAWNGTPAPFRSVVWKLLAGYLPPRIDQHAATLQHKRDEYQQLVATCYSAATSGASTEQHVAYRKQIQKDLVRMSVLQASNRLIELYERILFIWALRHPASGYVQGINDLVTPFFLVFLSEHTPIDLANQTNFSLNLDALPANCAAESPLRERSVDEPSTADRQPKISGDSSSFTGNSGNNRAHVDSAGGNATRNSKKSGINSSSGTRNKCYSVLQQVEADTFWCLSRLLDSIQDHYTLDQPGIQRSLVVLQQVMGRSDNALDLHLKQLGVEYFHFAFRWLNNLLTREMPMRCIVRLWDTYLAEIDSFRTFHIYVCAALLVQFAEELKQQRDFQNLLLTLLNLPTSQWTDEECSELLAHAFNLKEMFDRTAHVNS